MKTKLQSIAKPTLLTSLFVFVGSFLGWVFFYYFYPNTLSTKGVFSAYTESWLPSTSIYAHLLSFVLMIINSFLLHRIIEKYGTIRVSSFLPSFIYIALSTFWIETHSDYIGYLGATLLLSALQLTFGCYKHKKATEQIYLTFILLSLSILLIQLYAIFVLFFWIFYAMLQSLSWRTFLASLLGLMTPFLFILFFYYYGYGVEVAMNHFLLPFCDITTTLPLLKQHIPLLVYLSLAGLIAIATAWQMPRLERQDSIRRIRQHQVLKIVLLILVSLLLIDITIYVTFLPSIGFAYAALISYTIVLQPTRFNYYLFVSLMILSIGYSLYQFFTSFYA